MTRAELKKQAKELLKGNRSYGAILTLLIAAVFIVMGIIDPKASFITTAVVGLVVIGPSYAFLQIVDDNKEENIFNALFLGFTNGRFISVFLTYILNWVFITLWTILLIVPGIIKTLSYSQAFYIAKDIVDSGYEVKGTQAINASKELMKGHKMEYFVLQLSFLGWILLGFVTLGIGFLWIAPYIQMTNALFYRKLAGDKFLAKETQAEIVEAEIGQAAE